MPAASITASSYLDFPGKGKDGLLAEEVYGGQGSKLMTCFVTVRHADS